MSPRRHDRRVRDLRRSAPIFAALADQTRVTLLARLAGEPALSIARLTQGSKLTRQAITKHLRVLEEAGLVRSIRAGRESRYELDAKPLDEARQALEGVSRWWDEGLARLKALVEA